LTTSRRPAPIGNAVGWACKGGGGERSSIHGSGLRHRIVAQVGGTGQNQTDPPLERQAATASEQRARTHLAAREPADLVIDDVAEEAKASEVRPDFLACGRSHVHTARHILELLVKVLDQLHHVPVGTPECVSGRAGVCVGACFSRCEGLWGWGCGTYGSFISRLTCISQSISWSSLRPVLDTP
jgi:hypothetical protein